jgi:carbon-monoxide dehydrogenase iron sulfur subunit
MKGVISVNVDRCLGCRTCELECAVSHAGEKDILVAVEKGKALQPRLKVEQGEGFVTPLQCAHCDFPPCESICPTGAISKKELGGMVTIEEEVCIGCASCQLVCPYGIPFPSSKERKMVKCDGCIERLKGNHSPVCVTSCPTGALKFLKLPDNLYPSRAIKVEEQARKRSTQVNLIKCRICHRGFASEKRLARIEQKIKMKREILEICPECRRKFYARKISIIGGRNE